MKAFELLAQESSWTKGFYAKDAEGNQCDPLFEGAKCFCVGGALTKCYGNKVRELRSKIITAVGMGVASWNDDPRTTHQEIVTLLTKLDIWPTTKNPT